MAWAKVPVDEVVNYTARMAIARELAKAACVPWSRRRPTGSGDE